jgi:transposase
LCTTRFEELGWEVLVVDAHKVKGLAPLACKTDRIDARVLAVLSQRDLVPAIWLPDPSIRRERGLARFRLHLVRHRAEEPHPRDADRLRPSVPGLGPVRPGRPRTARPAGHPGPWRRNVDAGLELIDDLELQIARLMVELKRQGADHRYIPLLVTAPGFGWVNALRSPRRSATSPALPRPPSCAAPPACARASSSPGPATAAARSQSTARAICAGVCSKRR